MDLMEFTEFLQMQKSLAGTTNNSNAPTTSTSTTSAGSGSSSNYLNSNSTKHTGSNSVSEITTTSNSGGSSKRIGKGKEVLANPIDFNTFDVSVLRRYKRIHKLKVKEYASKEELVAAVSKHYAAQQPKEVDAIAAFIYSVHHQDTTLKLPIP
ncbi:3429_t:CDS:2 [Diversispora eburnea]|uniref:3429_t:CDS:1 n=1 Tax=Diversispora eburnea TaxID=1213867 RepID=A0A9N8VJ72_9GLOM|nr:3429_t:CDS:2 [Diversispora eburnea]